MNEYPLHARIEQILVENDDPADMLIGLVFELKAQGLEEIQIYDLLEGFRNSINTDQRENDQGHILDVMYRIVGKNFPHWPSFCSPLSIFGRL